MARTNAQPSEPRRLAIELPDAERGLNADQIARYDKARAMLEQSRIKLTPAQQDRHHRTIASIAQTRAEWTEKAWQDDASAETIALAESRGEEVAQSRTGAIRVNSRDPLLSLLRAGHLTVAQYDVGRKLRDWYEERGAGLGSQMGGIGSSSAPTYDNSSAVFYGVQRAKALQMLGRIERAVAVQCSDDPAALAMLRIVCDRGLAITSQGKGRAMERNAAALARALDVAGSITGG